MFCKLPRTASSAHLSLLPASSFRHLLSLLLNRVTKRPVMDLTGKTQAVLSPSTVKRFLEANKLQHKEGHAALTLACLMCKRETSQTVFINKTTGGLVCPPCKVHGELVRLGGRSAWSCCITMHVRMPCTEWPSQSGSTLAFYLANSNESGCEMNMLCCNHPLCTYARMCVSMCVSMCRT